MAGDKKPRSALSDVVTRDYTIHLHKKLQNLQHKRQAPRAIKVIKAFAKREMGTEDVRLDPSVNKEVWKRGIHGVAYRMRIRISRKRNDDKDAKNKLFSLVQVVNVANPKHMETKVVETEA